MKQKSLRALARELGVSASYLSQVKHGKRPPSDMLLSSPVYATLLSKSVKHLGTNRGLPYLYAGHRHFFHQRYRCLFRICALAGD